MTSHEQRETSVMRSLRHKKSRALPLLAALAVCVTVGGAGPAMAVPAGINLCAAAGTTALPTATVPVWRFSENAGTCGAVSGAAASPIIEVNVNDVVTVNVDSSALPTGHEATFEVPGFKVTSPATGQFTFTPDRAGTFVYQSSADGGRQMAMGLYGVLVVRASGAASPWIRPACSGVATVSEDCVLMLSALDPDFNATPDTFDMRFYHATWWLLNGTAHPNTPNISPPVAGGTLLLRYANAGYDNTSMMLLGAHEKVVARGGFPLTNPMMASTETIPAGGTEEAEITSFPAGGLALYNRNLHVTNGSDWPGGMLVFIK
jgi:FtsP/CotA-like multicopper oxidase with cupredoxin domain